MQGRGVSSAHRLNFYPEARLPSRLLPRVTLHLFRRHGQLCLPSLCPGSCGSGHLTSLDGSLKGPAPGAGGTGDPILCVCDELLLRAGAAGHWGPRGDRTLLESASSGDHGAGSLGPRCPALPSSFAPQTCTESWLQGAAGLNAGETEGHRQAVAEDAAWARPMTAYR